MKRDVGGGGKVSKWKQKMTNQQPEPEKLGIRGVVGTGRTNGQNQMNIQNLVLSL